MWAVIEPLLPTKARRTRWPGRKRLDDRLAPQGILSMLRIGIGWEHLPQELGHGSGMTCRLRLKECRRRRCPAVPVRGAPGPAACRRRP
ncbi:transposase [Streptosporangium sandarakinum]